MPQTFNISPLGLEHLDQLLAIEQEAIASLERPDLLRRNTPSMWRQCLLPPHLCLGAWDDKELAGFAVLYRSAPDDGESLAPLLSSIDASPYCSANFKICIVRPQWRGRGLQVLLGKHLGREARARGIDLLCATASPYNKPSVHSLLALGYQADHILTKYGYERMLFYCVNFDIRI